MKIFVITEGSYSDYHIEALFSTEELAKQYLVLKYGEHNFNDCNNIEEYELDSGEEYIREGFGFYKTYVNSWEPETVCANLENFYEAKEKPFVMIKGSIGQHTNRQYWNFEGVVKAQDIKHAIKIGMEKWMQYKAENNI